MKTQRFLKENLEKALIKQLIKTDIKNQKSLSKLKRKFSKQFKTSLSSNIDLLKTYHILVQNKSIKKSVKIEKALITRPIRSLSGIVNISVLTKPAPCPGKCAFCPIEKGFPKSYLAGEPAADRAATLNFDPYLQTQSRLKMLKDQGHPTDKIELRIIGGTWSYYSKQYQTWFITRCFEACNAELRGSKRRTTLKKEQKKNEKVKNRIVGLSIETRPDFITKKEIIRLRKLGVTLVEMGIQTVFDDILKKNKTKLTTRKIAESTKLLKNAGFKILYQIMPNLPGSTIKKDLKLFKILFNDIRFKPDWIKIYPCLICKNTQLYKWWKQGQYKPYTKKQLIKLLIEIKKTLPFWTRLTRLFRDIPAQKIIAGCKTSNLREVVYKEMKGKNIQCKCIRCREVRQKYNSKEKPYLFREDYNASEGKEIFLSFENKKRTKLFSLLRLRIPSHHKNSSHYGFAVLQNASIIREIQTFGQQLGIRGRISCCACGRDPTSYAPDKYVQHKGLGRKLIKKAEEITKKEFCLNKIAVISGIGAREYYRKHGYKLKNTYMVKKL
ncbi:MAG: tRNA uridine(34) 5-carboxymethylaminomethyl modification radical SAM/GNAT enzyme Elp3 [Candidatus Pacebacteria bacterium]|nr:tRNA uridine(34) 5-carboxymethylaminomethyl modification radical SAM/GNAT enzyme Elp3 [Candidatus Paceibacterota bacterium]